MNWKLVYFGHVDRKEVQQYVVDSQWQEVRLWMKGKTLQQKYDALLNWIQKNAHSRAAQVQCTNYVTALSRGGLVKVGEYR